MVTVEPGCYFIDALLDQALANPEQVGFFDQSVLTRFRGMGGVRLEDNVLVTRAGIENFVVVPRSVRDVEKACAGGIAGESDFEDK